MVTLKIENGYEVMQDVHSLGENFGIYKPDFNAYAQANSHCISPFEPIERLSHLQLLFSEHPYYGRENRYFNIAPWWYRVRFHVPANVPKHCVLRVGAADYFCDVYLNGEKLGSHEGYFSSFEFNADKHILPGQVNTCVIKVSAPWDEEKHDGATPIRCWNIIRNQIKGTYEHADSFLTRDINPIGLWKGLELDFYEDCRIGKVDTLATLNGDDGILKIKTQLDGEGGVIRARLFNHRTGELVAEKIGEKNIEIAIQNVEKWQCADHGPCGLYRLAVSLEENGEVRQTVSRNIGFRSIRLERTAERTAYYLNGKRLYIRGTTYFPEVYVSRMDKRRYRHDLQLLKAAGMNMIRIHVHVENKELYDLCDEMGMLVIQDSDLNWVSVRTDEFAARALQLFSEMLEMLAHHPCISTWVLYNEPDRAHNDYYMNIQPTPQMEIMAHERTPGIPTIRGSYVAESAHSGDSHNYTGSLYGETSNYLDKINNEKFNTEFGFDAPASLVNLQSMPVLSKTLNLTKEEIDEINNYQYRYTKYFIEDYRSNKYEPCSGYMQFLYSDPLPTSFYGAVDWWGSFKGAYLAMLESNQPFAAIFTCRGTPGKIYAVNDTQQSVKANLLIMVTDKNGTLLTNKTETFDLNADSKVELGSLDMVEKGCTVYLSMRDERGMILAENKYVNPLEHPKHPEGHPSYMDNNFCMHLYRNRKN